MENRCPVCGRDLFIGEPCYHPEIPSKEKRINIYWAAMFEIVAFGLCSAGICSAIDEYDSGSSVYSSMEISYPELHRIFILIHKSKKDKEGYWFPPGECVEERLNYLSLAIDFAYGKENY